MNLQRRDFVNVRPAAKSEDFFEVLRDFAGLVLVVLVILIAASFIASLIQEGVKIG